MTTQPNAPLSEQSLYDLLREYTNASFDCGAKDANGDSDTSTLTDKLQAIEFELYRREKQQAAEITQLREALEKIRDTARKWEGRTDTVPYWNLGDIAADALNPVSKWPRARSSPAP